MSSTGNPNLWGTYDSYRDCSQGVCSVYCPQWCYVIFPPPPSFFLDDEDDSSSSSDFSPLLIALIGILASAFILITYYTLISKYFRRSSSTTSGVNRAIISSSVAADTWRGGSNPNGDGLDETLIKSIRVYKYRKGDGFVESSDCSVCLSEFQEEERLRLLPKCNHAFHVPCIDTWLKSHSNCPLCRAGIGVTVTSAVESIAVSNQPIGTESAGTDSVSIVVNLDLETGSRSETVADIATPKPPELRGTRGGGDQANQNSGDVVLVADILREIEDEESAGVGTSRRVEDEGGEKTTPPSSESAANQVAGGISNFLARSYGRARNYRLPN